MNLTYKLIRSFRWRILKPIKNILFILNNVRIYKEPNSIYFDVSLKFDRYLLSLVLFYIENNFNVKIKFRSEFINHIPLYFFYLNGNPNFSFIFKKPTNTETIFCEENLNSDKNVIKLNANYFSTGKNKNSYYFPFSLHPLFYIKKLYLDLPKTPFNNRPFKIGFAGNLSDYYMDLDIFGEKYLSRTTIIKLIINSFKNEVFQVKSNKDFNEIYEKSKIIVLDRNDFNLSQEEYIEFISNCEYFICPPGLKMPLCHNLVECLSCGTIPILQYEKLVNPELINDFNCLTFIDEIELIQKLNRIITLESDVIQKNISDNCKKSYEEYFTPISVINRIEELKKTSNPNVFMIAGEAGELSINCK